MTSKWLAPAKLNLFLHITGKRDDGYHNLQTIFQFLDYSDELSFEITNDGVIQLEEPLVGVPDEDNLIIQAAKMLRAFAGKKTDGFSDRKGTTVSINKRLPMGGGLGGGSSNAATTLVALNYLWQLNLSNDELKIIGLKLGADVPVFIHRKACLAEGVGEKFTDVEPEQCWYLVIVPDCQVNTGEIFSNSSLTRNSKTLRIRPLLDWEVLGVLRNDCEALVKNLYPEVNQSLEWLSKYGLARMTGTGCCVFSPFPSEEEAGKIAALLPEDVKAFVAQGVNQSPLSRSFT
ncbi:MAG: 4-(cytidine 5'-diphospho)-2-C-methyl-D-erythritol kinase [Gammaproteobacteria bacterium]|nr:4-(cytidine 5'-diphospho)-2-C-methyl-D-erythritol kinase [Gammaproteobacteria bacterium]